MNRRSGTLFLLVGLLWGGHYLAAQDQLVTGASPDEVWKPAVGVSPKEIKDEKGNTKYYKKTRENANFTEYDDTNEFYRTSGSWTTVHPFTKIQISKQLYKGQDGTKYRYVKKFDNQRGIWTNLWLRVDEEN